MEIYMRMCKEAKQLQKLWKPKVGDYALCSYAKTVEIYIISKIEVKGSAKKFGIIYYINEINGLSSATLMGNILKDDFIWLITQEQLQEIWQKTYSEIPRYTSKLQYGWFGCFVKFVKSEYKDNLIADEYFEEMKELWLAFVMKEKYHKIWDGKTWVKST